MEWGEGGRTRNMGRRVRREKRIEIVMVDGGRDAAAAAEEQEDDI